MNLAAATQTIIDLRNALLDCAKSRDADKDELLLAIKEHQHKYAIADRSARELQGDCIHYHALSEALKRALADCISMMELQEQRQAGTAHLTAEAMTSMWRSAMAAGRDLLKRK